MALKEIIERLEKEAPNKVVKLGWDRAYSDRGSYYNLAFHPCENVTVGKMLEVARDAKSSTFQGYKGGDFVMHDFTNCFIAEWGECSDDQVGPLLLEALLAAVVEGV